MNNKLDIEQLQARLRQFAEERDWEQFNTPKNISMALTVETAELLELFQWLTPEQSVGLCKDEAFAARLGEEISDVLFYLIRLADVSGINLVSATERKLKMNAEKYPVEKARGNADKYTTWK